VNLTKDLYSEIRTKLESITDFKYVRMWNNQFDRENVNEAFQYPCAFIEFEDVETTDLLNDIQHFEVTVLIHIGFESYLTEDLTIFDLKQKVYEALGNFTSATGFFIKFKWLSDKQNFDHDNTQEFIMTFKVTGKEFSIDRINPSTVGYITDITINQTFD
jgi:hypothetical protein